VLTDTALPEGVRRYDLAQHSDSRGVLTEIFRSAWDGAPDLRQLNWVRSQPNVLRGMHVHAHSDWLIVISGRMSVGLFDARAGSPTFGRSTMAVLDAAEPAALLIPSGVVHGFYAELTTTFVYGLTAMWEPNDTVVIRWDDPGFGLEWPCERPIVSERDTLGLSLPDALRQLAG
jgi:dTDP-4-dehydrorhamnose 3,5-epimerase